MSALKPKIALLDEIDSGLDIDALKTVAEGIQRIAEENEMGIMLITHYQRMLHYVKTDFIHIMVQGKIVKSGGAELVEEIEKKGYAEYETHVK
jgi:Fe-S cluster assembly ATP-binding protein